VASITVTTGTRVTGRALAMNAAVTLDTNVITPTNLMTSGVTTTVGGAQTTGSGASFWDIGTLSARLEAGIGTRGLSAVDASFVFANPSLLTFGDLNLLGLTNPLASLLPKSLMYGARADWTADPSIAWGTPIQNPQGAAIVWGVSEDFFAIVWGVSEDDAVVWGTAVLTSAGAR
jgi:hypothetical protein